MLPGSERLSIPMLNLVRRSRLCPGCGEILAPPDAAAGERGTDACPNCGRGYSWGRMSLRPSSPESRRALEDEHRRRRDRAVRTCGFPLYGLDESWSGSRWVGGYGGSTGRVDEVDLAHGHPRSQGAPLVRVTTHPLREDTPVGLVLENVVHSLSQALWHEGVDHERVRPAFVEDDPLRTWERVVLQVSGQPVDFRYLGSDSVWGAVGDVGQEIVSVFARNVQPEGVRLVVISDPEPYINGVAG